VVSTNRRERADRMIAMKYSANRSSMSHQGQTLENPATHASTPEAIIAHGM
jgi:hypothetical protein